MDDTCVDYGVPAICIDSEPLASSSAEEEDHDDGHDGDADGAEQRRRRAEKKMTWSALHGLLSVTPLFRRRNASLKEIRSVRRTSASIVAFFKPRTSIWKPDWNPLESNMVPFTVFLCHTHEFECRQETFQKLHSRLYVVKVIVVLERCWLFSQYGLSRSYTTTKSKLRRLEVVRNFFMALRVFKCEVIWLSCGGQVFSHRMQWFFKGVRCVWKIGQSKR